jgi:hypothetical protein
MLFLAIIRELKSSGANHSEDIIIANVAISIRIRFFNQVMTAGNNMTLFESIRIKISSSNLTGLDNINSQS